MTTQPWKQRANQAIKNALLILTALPPMRLSEWAQKNFYLSEESSYVSGSWNAYSYQNFILDAFGSDDVEEVSVKKSARTGYTKMLLAASAFFATYRKRNQAIWQPTDGDAEEFVATEYDPMLRDVKLIKPIFPALEKKHKHNTNSFKKLIGCAIYIKGGSTARNYRRITVDVAMLDEIDSFDKDIDQEGSPKKLAKKRTEGATFPKLIIGSTPKLKYLSEIESSIETAEAVFKFHIPCPHCQHEQTLDFGGKDTAHGLKWVNNNPETAAYACIECHSLFTQADYLKIWHRGRWKDQHGNWYHNAQGQLYTADDQPINLPKVIGIDHLWTIYSPQASWSTIVKEFLDASKKAKHGDKSDLKTFINTTLGETYEAEVEKTESSTLVQRAEDFPLGKVPRGGLILMAGVDIQKDRFELFVWAFGREEEMWSVDYQVVEFNPAIYHEWDKLDARLLKTYPHAAGCALMIEDVGIDTGGHWTHQAYSYIRKRRHRDGWTKPLQQQMPRVYATKGSSKQDEKISSKYTLQDVNTFSNKLIKFGVKLYPVGTNKAKDLFFDRLQLIQPGPGYIHLSKHLPKQVFEHLSAEVRLVVQTVRGEVSRWEKRREGIRNEALDCTVMTLFCAHLRKLESKTKKDWDWIESLVQPNQNDLFLLSDEPESSTDQPAEVIPPNLINTLPLNRSHGKTFFIPD